jgi:Ni/Fe-hydrogenase subunit HybB-like protein
MFEFETNGFVFPNELHVHWTVMIVLYPYITGLVAGAFIVSSLYHLFGKEELRSIARFALVASFVFLLFAPLPLLMHLGMPSRAFNIMITPHPTSAMAGFGVVYLTYLVIVALEVWFSMREDIVQNALEGGRVKKALFRLLAFGDLRVDEQTRAFDHKVVRVLAGIGIPVACFLHGYVGFLFGSIKANPWWSTPLMFIIFLLSAIVSGISVLLFLFYLISWLRRAPYEEGVMRTLAGYLWGFLIIAVALEIMEVLSVAYEQMPEWEVLSFLIWHKLFFSYIVVQNIVGSFIPLILLALVNLTNLKPRIAHLFVFVSSILVLIQVLAMRWNVVIGGQLLSKSFRGFTSYFPGLFEKEGLITAFVIFTLPFLILRWIDKRISLFPLDCPIGQARR